MEKMAIQQNQDPCGSHRGLDLGIRSKTWVTPSNYVTLTVHPIAASFARFHVERTLARWNLMDLVEPARLIISELATNAVKVMQAAYVPKHGELSEAADSSLFNCISETFWVGLYRTDRHIVLQVWDSSRNPPKVAEETDFDSEGGRGLQLVTLLATEWGYLWPCTGGKIIWVMLALSPSES
jgi:hypothetical protein